TGGCLISTSPWAPGRSASPATCRTPATGDGSTAGTATNARSTPSGKTCRCGACACMTPQPPRRRYSMPPSELIPGSFLPPPPAAPPTPLRNSRPLPARRAPREKPAPVLGRPGGSAVGPRPARAQPGRGRTPDRVLDDLLVATSGAVTNALLHGRPPVTFR